MQLDAFRIACTALLLAAAAGASTGCASQRQVDRLEHRVDRVEDKVHEVAMNCCGVGKCDGKCKKSRELCQQTHVHNGAHYPSSRDECALELDGGIFEQKVVSRVMVQVQVDGTGQFYYTDPATGEKCLLDGVPMNWQGQEVPLEVVVHYRGKVTVRIRPVSVSGS